MNRRQLLAVCGSAGIASSLFPGALLGILYAQGSQVQTAEHDEYPTITPEMLDAAAAVAGIQLTPEQRTMMLDGVKEQREGLKQIRALKLKPSLAPAMVFDPRPEHFTMPAPPSQQMRMSPAPDISGIGSDEERIAFATVRELGEMLRQRKITSVDLTKLYLARLRRYDPRLHFVVTYTEDRALKQAATADRELAAGKYRGPLHGVPWGAKDLLSVAGYPTTWGARGMEQQNFDEDATVVKRLDDAGAVLVAKFSLGALAMGDLWFGGRTRNPWNPKQGSSGSSAGSSSAVSAGCVGFAIGSETLGSISSPTTRCGVTGLRPSFGLVPRTGAMPLSWSMDKLGPITRCVEDCALVLQTIHGADGLDKAVREDARFTWDAQFDWKKLRIGYNAAAFERMPDSALKQRPKDEDVEATKAWMSEKAALAMRQYDNRFERAALDVLKRMGVKLISVKMPDMPWGSMTAVLEAEGAASFDELTRSGADAKLNGQEKSDWPNTFRVARMYSAVDYVQAQRARSMGIAAMAEVFRTVDVIATPSSGTQLRITNLTGHPAVIVPNGVRGDDAPAPFSTEDGSADNVGGPGTPVSLTFVGGLYDDARLAAFARAYQQASGFERLHPAI
jgi:Asp-tRNA(Asn)/Glu-tRNA(Gln) amidotransferase A subunit family amidase